jgi:alkyl sulfatase BDS1-like metallo-beta-lactamase superfamily hydrolase
VEAKAERGQLIIDGFGGINKTISKIREALTNGKYYWAAELVTYVLCKYPDNQEAKLLKAQAFRILGWMNPTSGARNWYLTNARILEGKLDPAALTRIHGAKDRILNTPTYILPNLVRFNLNPEKSGDMNMTLDIKLNDTNQGYTLKIRKAVIEFQKSFPSKFDVAIYTNTDSLKKVIAGFTTLDDALNSGQVKLDGDVNNLKKFVSVLDTGLKEPGQATDADIG